MSSSPPEPGLLRIRAVSAATGIPADTLRVWERRYATLASHRSAAGYRLYTPADVARLRLLKSLVARGHAIGDVAPLSHDELARLAESMSGLAPFPDAAVHARAQFLAAVDAFDAIEAERVLANARLVIPTLELTRDVVAPVLHTLGDGWARGTYSVAQEHLASAVIRGHLGDVLRTQSHVRGAPVVIGTTPEGELHELGVLLAAIHAGVHGARAIHLGPQTPAADLAVAVRRMQARAVLVSCVALGKKSARKALVEIRAAVPQGTLVVVGGAAAPEGAIDGVTRLRSFEDLPAVLAD